MFYFFKGQTLNTFVLIVTNEFQEKDMLSPSMEVLREKRHEFLITMPCIWVHFFSSTVFRGESRNRSTTKMD